MHFFVPQKKFKVDDLFLSCHPQNTGRQRRFTVKIKQSGQMFLFSVHIITEAKQYAGLGRVEPGLEAGRWIFHLTWRTLV